MDVPNLTGYYYLPTCLPPIRIMHIDNFYYTMLTTRGQCCLDFEPNLFLLRLFLHYTCQYHSQYKTSFFFFFAHSSQVGLVIFKFSWIMAFMLEKVATETSASQAPKQLILCF